MSDVEPNLPTVFEPNFNLLHAGYFLQELSIYLPIRLKPRGGRQTGIPEHQVLRGLVETKW